MYFKNIHIENYGCIENLDYNFRFNSDGTPIPLVLIGKNGSGKSLLLTNLVDSIIEIKRNIYESIPEVQNNNYYKIGSRQYIRMGAISTKVIIKLNFDQKEIVSYDIMSNDAVNQLNGGQIKDNEINNKQDFEETGFSKWINDTLKKKEFESNIALYFPVDRYYTPAWYGPNNYKKIEYSGGTDIRAAKTNIIKIDLLSNIKQWLTDIYMSATIQLIPCNNDIPALNIKKGEFLQAVINTPIQQEINKLYTVITNRGIATQTINRKIKNISLATTNGSCYDISQLSEGEMNLYGIGLSIIKDWDVLHDNFDLKDISGIVIIDEADLGLHIDYAYRALPNMMALFPKVQFIITSHSPFLLAGLVEKYGNGLDVISMPVGCKVTDISEFCELQSAIKIVQTYNHQDDEIRKENENLIKLTQEINKIIIYTEGKTDVKYLKLALKRFPEYKNIAERIKFYDIEHATKTGDGELLKLYEYLQKGADTNVKICMFDRDVIDKIITEEYERGNNKTYRFNIPVPSFRSKDDLISIEHYLKDDELKTLDSEGRRIFLANEFDNRGISNDKKYTWPHAISKNDKRYNPLEIINGSGDKKVFMIDDDEKNYALTKDAFITHIENGDSGFNFNLDEFKLILDVIEKIVNDADNQPKNI